MSVALKEGAARFLQQEENQKRSDNWQLISHRTFSTLGSRQMHHIQVS